MNDTKFRQSVYWAIFFFLSLATTYILVTLVRAASVEDTTTMLQSSWSKKQVSRAVLSTSLGDIIVSFDRRNAPITVSNFDNLVRSSFYDGTKFHRVEKDKWILGGDPLSRETRKNLWGTGGPGYVFEDEIGSQRMTRGAIGMVHMNNDPDSNGSQFFILLADQPNLDGYLTVFGRVVVGMEIVDKIGSVRVDKDKIPADPVYLRNAHL